MVGHVYLLDTSVLLAALLAPERLPKGVTAGISESSNTVYFSSASIWEVAIKHSLQRANFGFSSQDIYRLALDTGFTELMVKGEDCCSIASLPWEALIYSSMSRVAGQIGKIATRTAQVVAGTTMPSRTRKRAPDLAATLMGRGFAGELPRCAAGQGE